MLAILYSVHDYNRNNMHDHVGGNMETTILVSYSTKNFIMCFKFTNKKLSMQRCIEHKTTDNDNTASQSQLDSNTASQSQLDFNTASQSQIDSNT